MSGSNRLAGLKARPKDTTIEEIRRVDEVGEGSHGSNLNGNYAPTRVSSGWKSTTVGQVSWSGGASLDNGLASRLPGCHMA